MANPKRGITMQFSGPPASSKTYKYLTNRKLINGDTNYYVCFIYSLHIYYKMTASNILWHHQCVCILVLIYFNVKKQTLSYLGQHKGSFIMCTNTFMLNIVWHATIKTITCISILLAISWNIMQEVYILENNWYPIFMFPIYPNKCIITNWH